MTAKIQQWFELGCLLVGPAPLHHDSRKGEILSAFYEFDCRGPDSPPLSISSGSRVIDTLSTVSRFRCRGWPTYRVDSRRTINSSHDETDENDDVEVTVS